METSYFSEKHHKKKHQSLPTTTLYDDNRHQQYASLSSDELMKLPKPKQNNPEEASIQISVENFVDEKFQEDYVPYEKKSIHQHYHHPIQQPHMHSNSCDRLVSAYDVQRDKRYYFTNTLTPVRVYIKYDKQHNKTPLESAKKVKNVVDLATLKLGNKINLQLLRYNVGVSKEFLKDASSMTFIKETLSFIPASAIMKKHDNFESYSDNIMKHAQNKIELPAIGDIMRKTLIKKKKL
jgi:hypothetical protein